MSSSDEAAEAAKGKTSSVKGTVKWFNAEKGFGFIAPDDNSADLFVHYTEIQGSGFRTLEENQTVEFEVRDSEKILFMGEGKFGSRDVTVVLTGEHPSFTYRGEAAPSFGDADSPQDSDRMAVYLEAEEAPVIAYVDSDDAVLVMRFYQQLESLLNSAGLGYSLHRVEPGSIFMSIKAWFRSPQNKKRLTDELHEVSEAGLQFGKAQLAKTTAQNDNMIANSIRQLSEAAGDHDYAVCLQGFVALRYTLPNGHKIQLARVLTPKEVAVLDKRPDLLAHPQQLLGAIGEIIALNEGYGTPENEALGGSSGMSPPED